MITEKYMCTVETKNYPVNTIRPSIQRYCSIKKKFNASEIACCIAANAIVTLHMPGGSTVKLTSTNFKKQLIACRDAYARTNLVNGMYKETKKNTEELEKIKEENTPVVETTSAKKTTKRVEAPVVEEKKEDVVVPAETDGNEEIQADPENPDTEDYSYIDSEE